MANALVRMVLLIVLLQIGLSAASLSHSTSHFQHWYPQYGDHFAARLRDNCSEEYQYSLVTPSTPDCLSCYIEPVVSCLLDNSKELEKSVMAAAGVVLGLLPTTMVFMGSNTVETGLVAIRRPILALLLSAASPSISPLRPFDYRSPTDILMTRRDARSAPPFTGAWLLAVSVSEYSLALAALANIIQNTWELSNRVVFAVSVETDYQAGLWLGLAVIVHCIGMMTLMLRVDIVPPRPRKRLGLGERFRNEWITCASQPKGILEYRWDKESYSFLFWSWLTSIGTVMFMIFGSCMFASVLFISLRDAIWVAVRYLLSVVLCRMVLAYELSGLRRVVEVPGHDEEPLGNVLELGAAGPSGYQAVKTGPNKASTV